MRQLEAVIFDMDGVLIDSEPIHIEIERQLFDKLGIDVSAEVHRTYLGTAGDFMYSDIKSRFGRPESLEELMVFDDLYRCEYFKNLKVLNLNEGVLNLLGELKSAGLKLAVATSSSPAIARVVLDRCGITSVFDAVVTTQEAGKSKPAPDVYLTASRLIGVVPSNCLVFEDSPNGMNAAKNSRMFCITVQTDSVDIRELAAADFQIESFKNLNYKQLDDIFPGNSIAV